jgi:hypothetical protein
MNLSPNPIPQNTSRWPSCCLWIVMILSFTITSWLAIDTRYINFWPTDSYFFYLPAAKQLFDLTYISDLHHLNSDKALGSVVMHGKEALILGIAIFQKILKDTESLYPNILLLICAFEGCALLIFLIFRKLFNVSISFLIFFLFITSFWPYMYILQGAHQPLALLFFLIAFYSMQCYWQHRLFPFLAGTSLGLMLFASPTAILYLGYFPILYLFLQDYKCSVSIAKALPAILNMLLFLLGIILIVIFFTMPAPWTNLKQFSLFIFASQKLNHFDHYYDYLSHVLPAPYPVDGPRPISFRGGGWLWIFKYFLLIMPIVFGSYLFAICYLLKRGLHYRKNLIVILLSLSTPLAVEMAQVSQFGRNYFSWYFGILFLIGYALYHRLLQPPNRNSTPPILLICMMTALGVHLIFNVTVFFQDIYPSRMGTARLQQWLKKNNIQELLVIRDHINNDFTASVFQNPKLNPKIKLYSISSIVQPTKGWILVPPKTGKNIVRDCADDDFIFDPFLNLLYDKGDIERYAEVSFPTLAASRYWVQEEEICTYRDLIVGQIANKDRQNGRMYILNAAKLHHEWVPYLKSK